MQCTGPARGTDYLPPCIVALAAPHTPPRTSLVTRLPPVTDAYSALDMLARVDELETRVRTRVGVVARWYGGTVANGAHPECSGGYGYVHPECSGGYGYVHQWGSP